MLSVNDAQRVAILNFLRCAHGRGEAGKPSRRNPPEIWNSVRPLNAGLSGTPGTVKLAGGNIETVGRNAIRVVIPIEPNSHVVHHGGTNGPGMPDGDAAGRSKEIP